MPKGARKKKRKRKQKKNLFSRAIKSISNAYSDVKDLALDIIKTNKSITEKSNNRYILIASGLIAISELTIPFTLNLIYVDVIPTGDSQQLFVFAAVASSILIIGGWLKQLRYKMVANNSGKREHSNKLKTFNNILSGKSAANSRQDNSLQNNIENLGLLKNQEHIQIQTLTTDILISTIFLMVLARISLILVAPLAIGLYCLYRNSGKHGREIESIKEEEYRHKVNESIFVDEIALAANAIKSNGLTNKFMASTELVNEEKLKVKKELGIKEELYKNQNSLISQSTYFAIAGIGSVAVNMGYLNVATLGTCLLMTGKIVSPWQQLFMLRVSIEKNKRAKQVAGYLLEEEGSAKTMLNPSGVEAETQRVNINSVHIKGLSNSVYQIETYIQTGKILYLNDEARGIVSDQLFKELSGAIEMKNFELNQGQLDAKDIQRNQIIYVDPTNQFFEGTIAQNITSYETNKYLDRAIYWSVLLGVDKYIRRLPNGYETKVGEFKETGLDSDLELGLALIRGLAKKPDYLLINCHLQAFGRNYIDIIESLVKYGTTEMGLVISADSRVLKKFSNAESSIKVLEKQTGGR